MALDLINLGAAPNDRTGDSWRDGGQKINLAIEELNNISGDNAVFVTSESSFPVQDATTITIEAGVTYVVTQHFITGKQFICEGGSLIGLSRTTGTDIEYTGVVPMFRIFETTFNTASLTVNAPSATVVELIGDGSFDPTQQLGMQRFTVKNCQQVATVQDAGALILDFCRFENVTGNVGFEFSGVGGAVFSFSRFLIGGLSAGAIGIDFGTVTTAEIEVRDYVPTGDPAAIAISGLAASGNLTAGGQGAVNGCNFSFLNNPLQNIMVNDVLWNFTDNLNVADSRNAADAYLNAPETVTISSAGTFFEVDGGNWQSTIQDRFVTNAAGVITYIGSRDIEARVTGVATIEKVGGGSDELEVRLAKNWTAADPGIVQSGALTDNTSPASVPVQALIEFAPGDDVRMIVANNDGTSNIIVDRANIIVEG